MPFRHVTDEECERINRLQADYFSRVKDVFDPPYPEGVPQRLETIVRSANITPRDTVVDIGTGTGVLIPLIQEYTPRTLYANDLSGSMLKEVSERYPDVVTLEGGVRKLDLKGQSADVFFINACYPNLVDKHTSFSTISRLMKPGGRVIISHPMGRTFTDFLKKKMPFPVDDFPATRREARELFAPYNLEVKTFVDDEFLYLLRLDYPMT